MRFTGLLICWLIFNVNWISAQKLSTFKIYTAEGKEVNFGKMMKQVSKADLIFIGELHNNPISHWLEMKVIKAIDRQGDLIIGMEMFERDVQQKLNDYLSGNLEIEAFLDQSRPWSNYKTDYAPIIEYAKAKKIPVIASNIPKQYASMVYKDGFVVIEGLVEDESKWIAPLPIPYDASLPAYKAMLDMVPGHGGENFPKAQAIKDATMADSIVKNWPSNGKFIHINGSYHSDDQEGIVWYINQYKSGTKMTTISTAVQSNIDVLSAEYRGKADFILVVDEDVTGSY